jgi:hypothetical protein
MRRSGSSEAAKARIMGWIESPGRAMGPQPECGMLAPGEGSAPSMNPLGTDWVIE